MVVLPLGQWKMKVWLLLAWQLMCRDGQEQQVGNILGTSVMNFFIILSVKRLKRGRSIMLIFQYKKMLLWESCSGMASASWNTPHQRHTAVTLSYCPHFKWESLSPFSPPSTTLCPEEIRIKTFLSAFFEVSQNPRPKSLFPLAILGTVIAVCTLHANFSD